MLMSDSIIGSTEDFGSSSPGSSPGSTTRRLLVTICAGNIDLEIAELTHPYMRSYAEKCKADFKVISNLVRFQELKKPQWIYEAKREALMTSGYESICYIDTDILILNSAEDIFALVPIGHIAAFNGVNVDTNSQRVYKMFARQHGLAGPVDRMYNNGVVVKATPEDIFTEKFIPGVYMDNDYMNYLFRTSRVPMFNLPRAFNYYAHNSVTKAAEEAYFVHYAGSQSSKPNRVKSITDDIKAFRALGRI